MSVVLLLFGLLAEGPAESPTVAPAASDDEIWTLARRVDTPSAYRTYIDRFPGGRHHGEAVEAFNRAQGRPAIVAPPAPPTPPTPPAPPPPPPPPLTSDACFRFLVDHPDGTESEEAGAFRRATRSNRLADQREFVARFPNGACEPRISAIIRTREARAQVLGTIPGFGPVQAWRQSGLSISSGDYPSTALVRGESGRVVVEWDVAEDGFAESCRVVESSRSESLDQGTCRFVYRLRYDPARDASGTPTRSIDRQAVTWVADPDSEPTPEAVANAPR